MASMGSLSEAKRWTPAFRPPAPEIRAETIQLLSSHDRPIIEAAARAKLEHLLRYHDEGHVVLLVLTIIESADNENALVPPVIEAVHWVMTWHPDWAERGSEWLRRSRLWRSGAHVPTPVDLEGAHHDAIALRASAGIFGLPPFRRSNIGGRWKHTLAKSCNGFWIGTARIISSRRCGRSLSLRGTRAL